MTGGRVVLADDDVLLREGLALLLEREGFAVVGQAGDPSELSDLVHRLEPTLVVLDVRMPPTHTLEGLEAAQWIRKEFPEMGILILSAHAEVEQALSLLADGNPVGYLLKGRVADTREFIEALERLTQGRSSIDPGLVHELIHARRPGDPLAALSRREREVLALMAEGRSNAGIARRIYVSEGTVEKHVRSMFAKLELGEALDDHRRVLAVLRFLDT